MRRRLKQRRPKRFTEEEDILLAKCIKESKMVDWNFIASFFKNRTTRQVRERWNTYLNPDINVAPWRNDEDLLLIEKINEFGFKWSKIGAFLKGRTQMSIKNRWNSHLKKVAHSTSNGLFYLDYKYNTVVQQQIRTSKQVQRHKTVSKILSGPSDTEEAVQQSRNKAKKKEETDQNQVVTQTGLFDLDLNFPDFAADSIFLEDCFE